MFGGHGGTVRRWNSYPITPQSSPSLTPRDPVSMHLLQRISLVACCHHFSFSARRIPGYRNSAADALSRWFPAVSSSSELRYYCISGISLMLVSRAHTPATASALGPPQPQPVSRSTLYKCWVGGPARRILRTFARPQSTLQASLQFSRVWGQYWVIVPTVTFSPTPSCSPQFGGGYVASRGRVPCRQIRQDSKPSSHRGGIIPWGEDAAYGY